MSAGIAGILMASQSGRSAGFDMPHHGELTRGWPLDTPVFVPVQTENVCDLEARLSFRFFHCLAQHGPRGGFQDIEWTHDMLDTPGTYMGVACRGTDMAMAQQELDGR